MTFFFPDSVDAVDPGYDFLTEAYSPARVRQQREAYAHEALGRAPYDGVLVSMAMAGFRAGAAGRAPSRYTQSQRFRLFYAGVRDFLRLDAERSPSGRRLLEGAPPAWCEFGVFSRRIQQTHRPSASGDAKLPRFPRPETVALGARLHPSLQFTPSAIRSSRSLRAFWRRQVDALALRIEAEGTPGA